MLTVFLTFSLLLSASDDIIGLARKTNEYFMAKYHDPTEPTIVKKIRPSNLWTRAVYYEGLMALYGIDADKRYLDYTDRWAEFHKWTTRNGVGTTDADDQCCAQTYIDRYVMDGGEERISQVRLNLDNQIASGRVDYWTWVDAIQMAMPVYAKFYKVTGDRKYLDYAMRSYAWTRDSCGGGLFNEDEGLWWRDKDYVPPYKEKDGHNCYWSRGNGWVYAALVRVMSCLSPEDPYYSTLAADFKAMSYALLKCQRPDGYWNVSLVSPITYGGPEMTGTALFLYGFYAAYLNAACYGIQMCDNICKAAFSRKLFKRVKQVQQNDLYDPILAANNLTYLTIPTLKVIPLGSHWYEVSYQWPWYDKEIKKIPVKVLQDKANFKIVNINNSGKLLLPEEQ